MANKKVVNIKYTSRDFTSIKSDLIDYARRYYPDTYKDFSDASFGSLVLDTVAYVGDIMSFYADYQANESFLDTSVEYSNILRLGKQYGYKYTPTNTSTGVVALYVIVPANASNTAPNLNLIPTLERGSVFSTESGVSFILSENVDFLSSNSQVIKVAEQDVNNGSPTSFVIKTFGKVVSGQEITDIVSVSSFQKFRKITLSKQNVSEIISIVDEEGNEYYEVDYLSQNIIYKSIPNINTDKNQVSHILKPFSVPRRFVVDRDFRTTSVVFGASDNSQLSDNDTFFSDPKNVVLNMSGKKYIENSYFDPNNLTNSEKLGIGPSNTRLFIRYRYNPRSNPNVSVGEISRVTSSILKFKNEKEVSAETLNGIRLSVSVDNEEPVVGNTTEINSQELKTRISNNFSAQGRAVTFEDYKAICYSMPPELGSIKRVTIAKDLDSLRRNLNVYVLSEARLGYLTNATDSLKENLRSWIAKNKIVNDSIDILDGKIINYEIVFKALASRESDKVQVLNDSISALTTALSIAPEMGEPFIISDILSVLKKVNGLIDVINVQINLKQGGNYSSTYFNIDQNTTEDGRIINVPLNAVMELKYPDVDIKGTII